MARRLKRRSTRPSTRPDPCPPDREGPRRGPQLVVWALVLTVFCGLALLSGQAEGFAMRTEASAPPPTPASAAPNASNAGGTVLAAAAPNPRGAAGGVLAAPPPPQETYVDSNACTGYDERRDYLPLNRWTSFELFVVDNSWIIKTRLFVSMIASLMFMAAGLAWRIIGTLMGFSYTFDMICGAAGPINSVGRAMSLYASWFLIPAWLFVLMAAVKRWTGGGRRGPASALRLIAVFLAATGMVFFIGDQSDKNQNNPTGRYTLPWMAATVQGWFSTASNSLYDLQEFGRFTRDGQANPVFYDNYPEGGAGPVTCAALDEALYNKYREENADTALRDGRQTMVQLSKIWEISLVRSWQTAQFGEGTKEFPSPAHASCRLLEAHAEVPIQTKMDAYDLSTGNALGTTKYSMLRGYFISPRDGEQVIAVAWGACKANDDGRGSERTTLQWDKATDMDNKARACGVLYGSDSFNTSLSAHGWMLTSVLDTFYFNGGDELRDKLGNCVSTEAACRYSWDFASAWLGANQAERLTQGLVSMIVSFVFLFVLGPMSIGLTVSSVALAGLVMILPVTMLLLGLGLPQGMRLIKLTGAAAAGDFYFTFALTLLTMFIDTTYGAIDQTVGSNAPNFFEQVAQGAAPLVALYLFRRLSKILGMGDISTTTGAMGFAAAAALRASGDPRLSRNPGERVSRALGQVGVGKMRLGALDERSLQRRLVNNAATRGMAGLAGRGMKRAARPLTDWTRDRYEAGRAALLRGTQSLQRRAASGTPAQRAAAYAGLTAGMAGLTVMAPPSVLATLPLMAFTGGAAALRGGQAAGDAIGARWRGGAGGDDEESGLAAGAAAGIPMAKSARTGLRQADDWHRNIIRVSDAAEQRNLVAQHTEDGLDMLRARQWGGGYQGGVNPDFAGFASEDERARALREMADRTGLAPDQFMMGDHGLVMPVPVLVDKRSGQRVFAQGTSVEQASHPVHYLDRYTLRRQMVDGVEENDDMYVARLTAQLRERGYVTDDGEVVDVFAAHGYDTRVPEVRERVAAFISGARDPELSRIIITARRSEDAAVATSREWVRGQAANLDQVYLRDVESLLNTGMPDAHRDIGRAFTDLEVEMPDGSSGTAGQLQQRLDQQIRQMQRYIADTQDLYSRQAAMAVGDFERELDRMTRRNQQGAQDIDHVAAQLRDALDQVSLARDVCEMGELRVRLADPGSGMDASDLKRAAERLTRQTQRDMDDWHEVIDKLTGAIYRNPENSRNAQDVTDALDELRRAITNRAGRADAENQEMIDRLEDARREYEHNRLLARTDPRMSADRPVNVRELLREMFRR
ncbi:hypothetical protein GCM10023085_65500 [Actinomadura viridis]|uniref:Uncharacterized protein YukE n=1 Tax=Actinomadura viridis TaxID=58110 RepID=A0A931GUD4_9ACTN|nr:hypothetical protein [Actinomadura viridis]MBG6093034.1 uncharacterized protein YukE [Actinomadura viridis]